MLVRWSPLEEMDIVRKQIDNIFAPVSLNGDSRVLTHTAPAEVVESSEAYEIRLMLPGVEAEKIELQATDKSLTLSAQFLPRELNKDEKVHLNQFHYGKFTNQFSFNVPIDKDSVDAKYANGILSVRLPKAEQCKAKEIKIQVNK